MHETREKLVSSAQKQQSDKPVLLEAIDVTLCAIGHRTKLYRSLVVGVGVVSLVSFLLAVLLRQWLTLSGLIILVPLTGGFLFCDSRLVCRWRTTILEMARLRGLDLAAFRKTTSGYRHLPPNSLQAMLATLRLDPDGVGQQVPLHEPLIVDDYEAREQKSDRRLLRATALLTGGLICLVAGASSGSVTLLLLGGSLGGLAVALARQTGA